MSERRLSVVRKRLVMHMSGFELMEPERLTRRLTSGLSRFATLWGAVARHSEPTVSGDRRVISWDVETEGPNWKTETRYTALRWDELMAPYVRQPWLRLIIAGCGALFEFGRTGTIGRYLEANVRYGLFVVYPIVTLMAFAVLATIVATLSAVGGLPHPRLAAPVLGLILFGLLVRFLGSRLQLDFALADWAFAMDLSRREVKGLEEMLDRFADVVVSSVRGSDADEVIASGVSLGTVMMAEALSRALELEPNLGRLRPRLAYLTVGSSLLKIGLHPAAEGLRGAVRQVEREPSLRWVEYQSKADPVSFSGTDPVAAMGMAPTGKPVVQMVHLPEMMSAERFRRARRHLLLLHRQFVLPNAHRYFYDFYQICFGPVALADRVALGERLVDAFAEDGSYPLPDVRTARHPWHVGTTGHRAGT